MPPTCHPELGFRPTRPSTPFRFCLRFLHDDSDLDPLIRMAVGHYQFEAIHPFTDGNGRTGRATCSLN